MRVLFTLCAALILGGLVGFGEVAWAQDGTMSGGPTNAGTEFFFSMPTNYEDPTASVHYVRLYMTSADDGEVTITTQPEGSDPDSAFVRTVELKAFQIEYVELTKAEAQCVNRSNTAPVPNDGIYRNRAVHISSDVPIVVYAMNRTSFTTDGMLLLPTNAIGREYIALSATAGTTGQIDYKVPSQYLVTAAYDGTEVSITPAHNSPNHSQGEPFTVSLDKGDVFSSMSVEVEGDVTGTIISATKPVSVTTGVTCAFLPSGEYWACDHLCEMLPPVGAWEKTYYSMPYATRLKGDLYRIVAGEANARIYIDGQYLTTLSAVGGTQGIGWVEYLPTERHPVTISSDKPILVAQYNNSQEYDGVASDPFFSILTPAEQFQTEIVLTTPSEDFPRNFINIISDSAAFATIEIAPVGTEDWETLVTKYSSPVRSFPGDAESYAGMSFMVPPGAYRIRGEKPLAAYIYGFDAFDSYGYPASLSAALLDLDDSTAPVAEAGSDDENRTVAGVFSDPEGKGERARISTVRYDRSATENYLVTIDPYEPGIASSVGWQLEVNDPTQDARAAMVAVDMAGNRTVKTVEYKAPVGATKPGIDVAPRQRYECEIGFRKDTSILIRNPSEDADLVIGGVEGLTEESFLMGGTVLPRTIPPGESDTLHLAFQTKEVGVIRDTIHLIHNVPPERKTAVELVIHSKNVVEILAEDHDFGTVDSGTTAIVTIPIRDGIQAAAKATVTLEGLNSEAFAPGTAHGDAMEEIPNGDHSFLEVFFTPPGAGHFIDSVLIRYECQCGTSGEKLIYLNGTGATGISGVERAPGAAVSGPAPNPATLQTALSYQLLKQQPVSIMLTDLTGRMVRSVVAEEVHEPGDYRTVIDLQGLPSGLYGCRLRVGDRVFMRILAVAR